MSEANPYELILTPDAEADLKKIDRASAARILRKMLWVAENAASVSHESLTGQWSGLLRWRTGDYRVIYKIDHEGKTITVEIIGHRRDVYDE